ncbi:MAG: hypothetical protein PHT51_00640 [Patescibacteria group bacterium]|nr:hypothetical protein [Patescibacteria group bacterium]MDD4610723.1 hypothetical protein [Patescibacteria group bacterium]
MKKHLFIIILVIFYIFIFSFLLKNSFSYLDPDLGGHLRISADIIKNHAVPQIDYYNYTTNGGEWVYHEWLSGEVLYWLYENCGYIAVSIAFALIMVAIFIVLYLWTRNFTPQKNNSILILIFITLGAIAMTPHVGVRLQEITVFSLLFLLLIIYFYNKRGKYKILFLLPFLFLFWTNAHGGFLIGLSVLVFWIIIKTIELILSKNKKVDFLDYNELMNRKQIIVFSVFALASFLATLINPYGLKLYTFLGGMKNSYYLTSISEWIPQYNYPFQYWQILYLANTAIALGFIIYYGLKKKNKINLWQICLTFIFFCLAIKSRRNFPLFFIASFPLVVTFFSGFLNFSSNQFNNKITKKIILFFLICGLTLSSFCMLISAKYNANPFQNYCSAYPCEAIKFLKSHPEYNNLKLFNNYNWGSYLLWEYPERQLFIDGRFPQYQYKNHTLLEEYHEFYDGKKLPDKLNEYNIKLIITYSQEKKIHYDWFYKLFFRPDIRAKDEYENPLKKYLEKSSEWKKIYEDKVAVIYQR